MSNVICYHCNQNISNIVYQRRKNKLRASSGQCTRFLYYYICDKCNKGYDYKNNNK